MNSLREALNESPENLPLRLVYARRCEEALSFNEALDVYEEILKKSPGHPSARLGIARSLFFQGEISEAEVRAQHLVEACPDFAEGHLFLCRMLCSDRDKDLERAAQHYQAALTIDPGLAEPALDRDLGGLLVPQGESDTSSTDFEGDVDSNWFLPDPESISSPFEEADGDQPYDDGGFMEALEKGMEQNGMKVSDLDSPTISFNEVGGLESVKEELRMKIVHPVKNPQLFNAYGISPGGSLLFYGPPGCGKTMIGEALKGEVNAAFYSFGLHQLLDAGAGAGAGGAVKLLHEIFHIAKMNAPSVLFLDELDGIAARRSSEGNALLNQLLHELDEVAKTPDGVLVVGATSAPWLLDPALHRSGRFDRKVLVSAPDLVDRIDIIRVLRNRIPVSDLDTQKIAVATAGLTGAELTAVFESAAERSIAGSLGEGIFQLLTTESILDEAERMNPSAASWEEMAREQLQCLRAGSSFSDLFQEPER